MGQEKLEKRDKEVVRAMGAFGGGIAGSGSVCGVLLGAVAVVSSLYSRGNLQERENPRLWGLSRKLQRHFDKCTECHGGPNCRDIARLDWQDRTAVKEYYSSPDSRRKYCIELVGDFSLFLGKVLEKELPRKERS